MRVSNILWAVARFLHIPAILGLAYVYFFPVVQLCSFPVAKPAEAACYFDETQRPAVPSEKAPFRLLAFGDPQLEGDTSLPDPNAAIFPSLETLWSGDVPGALSGLFTHDVPRVLKGYHKRLDLWGNDRYLAHIYWLVKWWTAPTHMVVLGDLLGSQWIRDAEFQRRSDRFWHTVFKGAKKVPDSITGSSGRSEVLGQDPDWSSRIIAVAGNHDIGYSGDISPDRIERFEKTFGGLNWDIRFRLNDSDNSFPANLNVFGAPSFLPLTPELRVIILNSMNLDGPALNPQYQVESLEFMRRQLHAQQLPPTTGTLLLTHIPLHKEAGICVDGPFYSYFDPEQGGGIREQNHLSEGISAEILSGLVGAGRSHQAAILNGHDHAGCDVYHYVSADRDDETGETSERWKARHFDFARNLVANESISGLREITARSMMGNFGGNTVMLSAWFDKDERQWKFDYEVCALGVQHIWWGVHVFAIVEIALAVGSVIAEVYEVMSEVKAERKALEKTKQKNT